jgi:AraC-like DNA-binding protein
MKRAWFEKIPLLPGRSLVCREFRVDRFTPPWHFHPEMELTLIVTGRGLRYVGDSIAAFQDGDLALVGSNVPHFWWKDPADRRRGRSIVIQFHPECPAAFWGWPEASGLLQLMARAARGLQFAGASRRRMELAMLGLRELAPWPQLLSALSILSHPVGSRDAKPLASAGYAPVQDPDGGRRMAVACSYVHEQFGGPIRQPEAARRASLSPAAFSRYFHRHMGKTFESYVNEVRIGQACRLLGDEAVTIAEAAFGVGYNNLSNFNRRFRAVVGCAPSEFRARRA